MIILKVILFYIILLFAKCHKKDFAYNDQKKLEKMGIYKHKTDILLESGFCNDLIDEGDYVEKIRINCYYKVYAFMEIANNLLLTNQTDIQIKNSSSYSRITFTFKDQVVVLAANEISKIITVPFDPVGLYKIETSSGVVFQNSSFNFRGSLKDGTIITTDGTLINDLDLAGCNLINVETGKVETVSGQCLTPTNP